MNAIEQIFDDSDEQDGLGERSLGWRKRRAVEIGRQEAKRHGDFDKARDATRRRLNQEFGSIVTSIILGLLLKAAIEAIWAALKSINPAKFSGSMPTEV